MIQGCAITPHQPGRNLRLEDGKGVLIYRDVGDWISRYHTGSMAEGSKRPPAAAMHVSLTDLVPGSTKYRGRILQLLTYIAVPGTEYL